MSAFMCMFVCLYTHLAFVSIVLFGLGREKETKIHNTQKTTTTRRVKRKSQNLTKQFTSGYHSPERTCGGDDYVDNNNDEREINKNVC
jgi:hypothetical protein